MIKRPEFVDARVKVWRETEVVMVRGRVLVSYPRI